MSKQDVPRVPETIDFPAEEENILDYWKKIKAFQTCLKTSKNKPKFSFYDGPPFATGLPHYGHILAGTIKDVVTRYAHQQGFHVERRFGWDCHGLPIEYEIDKALEIKSPHEVMKMGIDKYNAECRAIVTRYSDEWEKIVGRIGRWIDFENDYKTMYSWYMESIWWVFKQLYDKGLVYQGTKVMPYSTACGTPLSNFECSQNYKEVVDPAITVSLPIIDDKEGASLLIWTTTPWTLPSNLSACVNPDLIYARFRQMSANKIYVMLECSVDVMFKAGDYEILKKFPGSELKGVRYEPIFPYYKNLQENGSFRVLVDNYVTADTGTGIVHQAPYFGEDDYRVCLLNGIITKDQDPICPLDAVGNFVMPVSDFLGQYVKDADRDIIQYLKKHGRLVQQNQINHSYPFCWRSDTPLIYRAVPSWFIRVEQMRSKMIKATDATHWVPDFVKEKRFGNWLKEARDWAVSRNRFWGTPIPIWKNGDEIRCIGSIAELEKLTGHTVKDLHRENIDQLFIPSRLPNRPALRRIPEVFDCWFESGCMPYAQDHHPFKNAKHFEEKFPADFIAEGIDQTRGWFYTLIVVSTALYGKAPFKNVIASGLVLASDGQKMSKRKKNYPDPMNIVSKYGADALRLYLISSPVVRAENLRFKEEGVKDIVKDVFLPWYNALRFLLQNVESYVKENDRQFYYKEKNINSINIMDCWIISYTQSLLEYVRQEMDVYHLYNVVPRLTKFIDHLTNWYIRMNRKRLKGETGTGDRKSALTTLYNVLYNMAMVMAPFVPFLSEYMYLILRNMTHNHSDSVHYLIIPHPNKTLLKKNIEIAVTRMQTVIELGRVIRERRQIPNKYPLPEVAIVHEDSEYIKDVLSLKEYILSELNIRKITTTTNKEQYGITVKAKPDYQVLGTRLRGELKAVAKAISQLTNEEITEFVASGHREIVGHLIAISEIQLTFESKSLNTDRYLVNSDNDVLVLIDIATDPSLQDEGVAREIINRIQKLRKKAHLVPTDEVTVFYQTQGELERISMEYQPFIEGIIKAPYKEISLKKPADYLIIEEEQKLKDSKLHILLSKLCDVEIPYVRWANLEMVALKPRFFGNSTKGLILMEVTRKPISMEDIRNSIFTLFGVDHFDLWAGKKRLEIDEDLLSVNSETIFITPVNIKPPLPPSTTVPFCKVHNFEKGSVRGTVILENPKGSAVLQEAEYTYLVQQWLCNVD